MQKRRSQQNNKSAQARVFMRSKPAERKDLKKIPSPKNCTSTSESRKFLILKPRVIMRCRAAKGEESPFRSAFLRSTGHNWGSEKHSKQGQILRIPSPTRISVTTNALVRSFLPRHSQSSTHKHSHRTPVKPASTHNHSRFRCSKKSVQAL